MNKHWLIFALTGAITLIPAVNAQDEEGAPPERPEKGARFDAADTDGDGFLSFEEMNAKREIPAERFSKIDSDGDGLVSREEMKEHMKRVYKHSKGKKGKGKGGPPPAEADGSTGEEV